jgi:hypothetical protein
MEAIYMVRRNGVFEMDFEIMPFAEMPSFGGQARP